MPVTETGHSAKAELFRQRQTRLSPSVLLALFFSGVAFGQSPTDATISGKITDATTRQPIAGADVSYCCGHADATTDVNGAFSLHVKPDGAPGTLRVAKTGYATIDPSSSNEMQFRLTPGSSESRDFELSRASHITGRVVDHDSGKPLAGFVVIAAARSSQYSIVASARPSDADGSFAIGPDLVPGDYSLEIDPPSKGRISGEGDAIPDQPGYARSWFPDVSSEQMAATVTLSAGEQREIELQLHKRELHHVAGVFQLPPGMQNDGISMSLSAGNRALSPIVEGEIRKAGPFRIDGIGEGTYRLTAMLAPSSGSTFGFADQMIEVTDHSVDDLKLALRPAVGLHASVTMEEDHVELPTGLRFEADPLHLFIERRAFRFVSDSLSERSLPPGEYWPVLTVPKGYAVASVSYSGQPVSNTTIDLEAAESTVNFVLTSRPAGVTGIVRDANQNPMFEASVALLPESLPDTFEKFDQRALQVANSDANGTFHIAGLAPGRYKIVPLTGNDRQHARDLAFLRDQMRSVDTLTLDFGQTATLDLVVK